MKLIGIDLDGTLLNDNQEISSKNRQKLENLPPDFFPFICSGREVYDIKKIMDTTNITIPLVGLNGAIGLDGEEIFLEKYFLEETVEQIYKIVKKFPTKIYTNKGSYESPHYQEKLKEVFSLYGSEFSIDQLHYELAYEKSIQSLPFVEIEEVSRQTAIKIYKVFLFVPNRKLKKQLVTELKQLSGITVTESADVNLEIVPSDVSKGLVFEHIEKRYGLDKPTRVAIGDSLNDLSMFEYADICFAMGNGHDLIKERADYITVSNDEAGVSQAFDKLATL